MECVWNKALVEVLRIASQEGRKEASKDKATLR